MLSTIAIAQDTMNQSGHFPSIYFPLYFSLTRGYAFITLHGSSYNTMHYVSTDGEVQLRNKSFAINAWR